MLAVLHHLGMCEPQPRAGPPSGSMVWAWWQLQVGRDGSMKARAVAQEFATTGKPDLFAPASPASSADVMDMMALIHGWSRAAVDATDTRVQADGDGPASLGLPVEWLAG